MSRRLIDYDPVTGIAHYSEWNDLDDAFRYTSEQEADPIIEAAHAEAANAGRHGDGLSKVGTIPLTLWAQLKREGIIDDPKRLMQWLDEHSKFKTR